MDESIEKFPAFWPGDITENKQENDRTAISLEEEKLMPLGQENREKLMPLEEEKSISVPEEMPVPLEEKMQKGFTFVIFNKVRHYQYCSSDDNSDTDCKHS